MCARQSILNLVQMLTAQLMKAYGVFGLKLTGARAYLILESMS